jgi:hypothetical protein
MRAGRSVGQKKIRGKKLEGSIQDTFDTGEREGKFTRGAAYHGGRVHQGKLPSEFFAIFPENFRWPPRFEIFSNFLELPKNPSEHHFVEGRYYFGRFFGKVSRNLQGVFELASLLSFLK